MMTIVTKTNAIFQIDGTGSVGAAVGPYLAAALQGTGNNANVFYMLMTADVLSLLVSLCCWSNSSSLSPFKMNNEPFSTVFKTLIFLLQFLSRLVISEITSIWRRPGTPSSSQGSLEPPLMSDSQSSAI